MASTSWRRRRSGDAVAWCRLGGGSFGPDRQDDAIAEARTPALRPAAEGRASQSVPVRGLLLRTLPADRPRRRVRWPSVLHELPRASSPFVASTAVCTSRPAESFPCELWSCLSAA